MASRALAYAMGLEKSGDVIGGKCSRRGRSLFEMLFIFRPFQRLLALGTNFEDLSRGAQEHEI
jgi:hypothetical protein